MTRGKGYFTDVGKCKPLGEAIAAAKGQRELEYARLMKMPEHELEKEFRLHTETALRERGRHPAWLFVWGVMVDRGLKDLADRIVAEAKAARGKAGGK